VRLEWLEGFFGTVGFQFREMNRQLPTRARPLATGWRAVYLQALLTGTANPQQAARRPFLPGGPPLALHQGGMPKKLRG
jgi:hypothetical protein